MENVNRKTSLILMLFLVISLPGTSLDVDAEYNFHDALNYAFYANIDTLVLITSGGIYTTPEVTVADSAQFVIYEPIVIMAADDLPARPIFTHPNGGESTSQEIFRVLDDVEFIGVNFMGGIDETEGCKYGLRFGDYIDPVSDEITRGKEGTKMIFNDCHFEGFHSLKDQLKQGNAIYYKRPEDENLALTNLRNTSVIIENCTFKDIGDEAIRISEGEKYGGTNGVVACSLLVVRNTTFDDIDAECIRIYGDKDTSQVGDTYIDGTILVDHVTTVNSAPRFIFAKNFRNATVRNVLLSHGRGTSINRPDRGDYSMQVQLSGSTISHVDTFSMVYSLPLSNSGRIGATKGGEVDTTTVYGFDPMFVDHANGDYTLAVGSPLYNLGSDGEAIGDLRWATNPPVAIDRDILPDEFTLSQNYPNPFNPVTTIDYYISQTGPVKLTIYNILGNIVATPVDNINSVGLHTIQFDASGLATGLYFYELQSGQNTSLRKMLLIK